MSGSILLINAAGRETRVALVENGHIAEFYLERKKDKGIVGNIYKGRVVRVLPGMQAAFVDVGLDKAAFLYVSDVVYDPDFARAQFELTEGEHEEAPDVPEYNEQQPEPVHVEADIQELSPAELAPPEGEPVRQIAAETPAVEPPAQPAQPEAVLAQAPASEPAAPAPEASAPVPPPAAPEASAPVPPPAPETAAAAPAPAAPASAETSAEGAKSEAHGERRAPRDGRERAREGRRERQGHREEDERQKPPRKMAGIEELLKVGQEVVVQISKDPIGTKGARLTSHISLPGRHLVFMPTVDHVGISRRISNEKERRRLRDIVERLRPPGTGFIVRTVAESVPQEKLESDIRFLIEIWNHVVRRNEKRGGPGLLHPDLDLILRATRDLFAHDVERLVVDDREEYERILQFVSAQDPALRDRVSLHDNDEPIFDAYGIEQEINRAVQRKVWLKSGGYLIIDQAEALTAIDVNSGRYVGKKSLEETITKINIEAAKEIVYQLRLRNIGGIIICDFIDMEKPQNRDRVFRALQEALGRDKAKTNVLRISELGLVEMTRKRVRESIGRILHEDCTYCDGKGFVKTATTVAYEIFRKIRREAQTYKDPVLNINCHPDVAKLLQGDERQELRHLMDRFNKSIQVRPQPHYHREQYDVYGRPPSSESKPQGRGAPRRDGNRDRPDERGGKAEASAEPSGATADPEQQDPSGGD
jgi:ribonuclease G